MINRKFAHTIAIFLIPIGAIAGEFDPSGSLSLELRGFPQSAQFPDQMEGLQSSLVLQPELLYDSDDGKHQFSFKPFLRLDARDDERSHFDVREVYWRYVADDWEFLAGVNQVFWGVTESRHLVNIINQVDFVEDIDEEDFLGQPMLNFATQRDWGEVSIFLLPHFRERTAAGRDGRLRAPLPVDVDDADYESGAEEWHPDIALRYSHYVGDWDIGASYFYGTSREPRLTPNPTATRLIPRYDLINQLGVDLQYTKNAWLWKFEGIAREGQGDTFGAMVGGFEYTFYQVGESAADVGVLAELQFDDRDEDEAPATAADHDLFLGARLALNDTQDTSLLAGTIIDLEDASTGLFVEAERRLGESWKIELESRWFINVDDENEAVIFERDSFVNLRLSWFF